MAQPPTAPKLVSESSLISPETKIDYTPLQVALNNQQFQKANEITHRLLLTAAGRIAQGWFRGEDIEKLPCWDLKTIDTLWKTASKGRFGFSVQYDIFVKTGNRPGRLMAPEAYDKFGEEIGWRQNNQWTIFKQNLNYTLQAPVGHLPNPRDEYQINGGRLEYTGLMGRLQSCKIVSSPNPTPSPKPSLRPSL
ncbi:periplasmic protein, function unknown [Synechocystis sp. LKSZ1]